MEEFIKKLREVYPLSDGEIQVLLEHTEQIVLPKGSRIMTAGKVENYTYFIVEGLARGFFTQEGKDITISSKAVYEWLCIWKGGIRKYRIAGRKQVVAYRE